MVLPEKQLSHNLLFTRYFCELFSVIYEALLYSFLTTV